MREASDEEQVYASWETAYWQEKGRSDGFRECNKILQSRLEYQDHEARILRQTIEEMQRAAASSARASIKCSSIPLPPEASLKAAPNSSSTAQAAPGSSSIAKAAPNSSSTAKAAPNTSSTAKAAPNSSSTAKAAPGSTSTAKAAPSRAPPAQKYYDSPYNSCSEDVPPVHQPDQPMTSSIDAVGETLTPPASTTPAPLNVPIIEDENDFEKMAALMRSLDIFAGASATVPSTPASNTSKPPQRAPKWEQNSKYWGGDWNKHSSDHAGSNDWNKQSSDGAGSNDWNKHSSDGAGRNDWNKQSSDGAGRNDWDTQSDAGRSDWKDDKQSETGTAPGKSKWSKPWSDAGKNDWDEKSDADKNNTDAADKKNWNKEWDAGTNDWKKQSDWGNGGWSNNSGWTGTGEKTPSNAQQNAGTLLYCEDE